MYDCLFRATFGTTILCIVELILFPNRMNKEAHRLEFTHLHTTLIERIL